MKNLFDKEQNYNQIITKINKNNKRKRVIASIIVCTLLVSITSSIVYAKEIKNFVNEIINNNKKYTIEVNNYITLNSSNITSLQDLEENINVNILNNNDFFKYSKILTKEAGSNIYQEAPANKPSEVLIMLNNYEDYKCLDFIYYENTSKKDKECKKQNNTKKLSLKISFATQYAIKEEINNLNISINKDNDTKIINDKIIKTSYNEYIIVVNNIIYTFDNFNEDYSEEEIIKLIKKLVY